MSVATKQIRVSKSGDAAKRLLDAIGDISGIFVLGPRILVAVYERAKHAANSNGDVVTKGGVIIGFKEGGTLSEDQWQGKVCLVLKKGGLAFAGGYASGLEHSDRVEVGDWIVIRPTDGFAMLRGGTTCRLVTDSNVLMKVPAPDTVW